MRKKKEHYESDFIEKQLNYCASLPEKQRHFLPMEYLRDKQVSRSNEV